MDNDYKEKIINALYASSLFVLTPLLFGLLTLYYVNIRELPYSEYYA